MFIDFSDRANASGLGNGLAQTLPGSGTGYWGIKSGAEPRGARSAANNRTCVGILAFYTVTDTRWWGQRSRPCVVV